MKLKMQMPPVEPMPALTKRLQLVRLWQVGLGLMLVAIVSDITTQTWQEVSRAGSFLTHPDAVLNWVGTYPLQTALVLGAGALGLFLNMYAANHFQKWPQPRFTAYGINKGMDERDVELLLEAQAGAQRLFVGATFVLTFLLIVFGRSGFTLSWWTCLLLLSCLTSAVIYLPTVLLARSEADLEDGE